MRAIDDGSRRPSLPTNVYVPQSTSSGSSDPSASTTAHELSPGGSSASESAFEESEVDQDEADHAEFDTDVELDLPQAITVLDRPVSDTASQHTFGNGGSDTFGFDREDDMSVDGSEDGSDSVSPVMFKQEAEEEALDDGDRPLPLLPIQTSRRGSVPWDIPTTPAPSGDPSILSRDREDSAATVVARGITRVVDRDAILGTLAIDGHPTSHPQTRAEFMSIEMQALRGDPRQDEALSPHNEYTYGEYDLNYILGTDVNSRKSWASSSTPSYVQPGGGRIDAGGDPGALGAAWDAVFAAGRRPSTVTVGSGDDAFARQVRRWDPEYTSRKDEWSFKKESTDGRGPHRMSLATTAHPEVTHPSTMAPGTQELWRQAYIGRFKVDRVKMNRESIPLGIPSVIG